MDLSYVNIEPQNFILTDAPQGLFYNQHFEPEFSVGIYLRYFGIAKNLIEEIKKSKEWKIYVRKEGVEIEINNMVDAEKNLEQECTLIMRENVQIGVKRESDKISVHEEIERPKKI